MDKRTILIKLIPLYCTVFIVLLIIAVKGSRAVTTFQEGKGIADRNTVIIDAGHGGVDGGATSYSGVPESKINLEIALRLEDLFHLMGINTVMIRRTDESVHTDGTTISQKKLSDLKERVRIANEINHGFLISIHQNYYSDRRYYGPQIFYKNGQGSKIFAENLQNCLNSTLAPESNRKSKISNSIYLLNKINCNGVLVECGFLSNPAEDIKLNDPQYQKKLCAVIVTEYVRYLDAYNLS